MPIEIISENCNQKKEDTVNVFVAQPKWEESDWKEEDNLFFPANSQVQIDYINMYLEKSLEINSDIVVFPELSILENHLVLIKEWAQINNKIVIAGSQYYIDETSTMNIAPIYINKKCIKKEKTIAASLEKSVLIERNLKVGNKFIKFENTICGTLCVFICAEYLDENTRHKVLEKDDIDVLIIIALQKDSSHYYKRIDLTVDESNPNNEIEK